MNRLVDLYVYRKEQNIVKTLILKRAKNVIYSGQWRMIGGKVKKDEKAYEAALRELVEETRLKAKKFWAIPSVNQFYDPKADTIRQIPAFAAEVDYNATVSLNHEHVDNKWISEEEVEKFIFWPEQRRLIKLLISIVTKNEILEEWKIQVKK